MKTTTALCMGLLTLGAACGETTFVAQESDLKGFSAWTQTTTPKQGGGASAALLGSAHDAMDSSITRTIYINNNATRVDGQFPIGTILLKAHTKAGVMTGGTAMAKRGGDFNPSAKGWEWFILNASGGIMARGGAEVLDGACNSCHNTASATDFVFTR